MVPISSNLMKKTLSQVKGYIPASQGRLRAELIEKKPSGGHCQGLLKEVQLQAIDFHVLFL